jgi:diacylglycerol O-acyltransferase
VLGARLLELIPQLPLFEQQGLGVAVLSYCGQLHVGLIGDRELASDLGSLRESMLASFEELEILARSPDRTKSPRKRAARPLRGHTLRALR